MTETAEQKVAIVTGASQGIGAGAVQAYRKLGYAVVANSRHITSSGDPGVLTVPGDIADPETGAGLVDRAVERFGRVDTLVNISTSLVDHANSAVPSALASLTKGGLNAVTRSLAIEYAGSGVRVNTVSPGIIRTPMHAEDAYDTLPALHPVGRMGDVGDIVEAIAYLETAEFVTGEILHVDGGQSAGH